MIHLLRRPVSHPSKIRSTKEPSSRMVNLITLTGVLALAGGGIGYFTFPMGLEMGLKTFVNLKENGMVFPLYKDPPFGTTATFLLYEIKNPRDFLLGQKMKLNLKGPYVYRTILYRDNVAFSNSQKLVKYDTHRKLMIDEEASADLDEKFWMLNPIFVGIQKSVKDMVMDKVPFKSISEPIVFNAVNVLVDQYRERLVVRKSPRELLEGTKVELLESLTNLADRFGLKTLLPPGPPENTFGLSHAQNHTVDVLEIYTGVGSPERFAEVYKWKGKPKVEQWTGKCSVINGTNGELYKPFVKPGKPIKIFLSQLCRTFNLDPVSDEPVQVQDGMMALEYELSPRLFAGARSHPNNKCYCRDTRTYDCQYDGLVSMGPCFFEAPLYFAPPNFRGVDRRIRGLLDEDTLESESVPMKQSFFLEPTTGTVLKVNLSLTGVFKVVKQRYMRDLGRVQNLTYAPLFVATETIALPSSVTWQLKLLQRMNDNYKPGMLLMAASGGGILLMGFLFGGRKVKPQPVQQAPAVTGSEQQ